MTETPGGATQDPGQASSGALELVARAARDGAADAREAATRTWAATSLFASRFVYTTCYTVSYGVVFPVMFLACSIPQNNSAVRGLIDGAHAAMQKAEQCRAAASDPASDTAMPSLSPA
jgi:hypothetical protein